jgi:hypothetical protein
MVFLLSGNRRFYSAKIANNAATARTATLTETNPAEAATGLPCFVGAVAVGVAATAGAGAVYGWHQAQVDTPGEAQASFQAWQRVSLFTL